MRKVVRRPNKTKAVVCFGAAVAVLVGGYSTFARWAGDADLILTDDTPAVIKAGEWDLDGAELPIKAERWFDSSPEILDAAYGHSGNKHILGGDQPGGSLSTTFVNFPATQNAVLERTPGGLMLVDAADGTTPLTDATLVQYAVVPGDQLTAIYVVDLDKVSVDPDKLVGEHLYVEVAAVTGTADNPIFIDSATIDPTWGDVVQANAYTASSGTDASGNDWADVLSNVPTCYDSKGAVITLVGDNDKPTCLAASGIWGVQIAVVIDYDFTLAESLYPTGDGPTDNSLLQKMKDDYIASHVVVSTDIGTCTDDVDSEVLGTDVTATECTALATAKGNAATFAKTGTIETPGTGETMTIAGTTPLQITGLKVSLVQKRPYPAAP